MTTTTIWTDLPVPTDLAYCALRVTEAYMREHGIRIFYTRTLEREGVRAWAVVCRGYTIIIAGHDDHGLAISREGQMQIPLDRVRLDRPTTDDIWRALGTISRPMHPDYGRSSVYDNPFHPLAQ